jgi:probable rRNA maturation factor
MTIQLAPLTIVYEDERWNTLSSIETRVHDAVRAALIYHGTYGRLQSASDLNAHTTIILANNAIVADLNQQWRGKTGPTNVLSFPVEDSYPSQAGCTHPLGDIILAYETVLCESEEQGKRFQDHVMHLIVHGVLHLVGYDHETEDDAEEMEEHERRILANLGITDPYSTPPLECNPR